MGEGLQVDSARFVPPGFGTMVPFEGFAMGVRADLDGILSEEARDGRGLASGREDMGVQCFIFHGHEPAEE